jgi:hypothetical protein
MLSGNLHLSRLGDSATVLSVMGIFRQLASAIPGRAFLMIGSSDNDAFDKRRHLWRLILPNRQLAKVCSFEQTAVDESSENLGKSEWMDVTFCFTKMHDAYKGDHK